MEQYKKTRPFDRIDEGKQYLMKILEEKGFQDVTETGKYDRYDLIGTYAGKTWIFELKNRDFPSGQFGDAALEEDKVKYLLDTPFKPILVYFWEDAWTMIDLRNTPYETISRTHRKTTRFGNNEDVTTTWASWKLDNIKLFPYK